MNPTDGRGAGSGDLSVRGDGPLLLLVGDDERLQRTRAAALAREGYRVEATQNARTALAALRRTSFDVLVSEVSMPGMSGVELVEQARAAGIDVPIVLLTGAPLLDAAVKSTEAGVLCYLANPIQPAALARVRASANSLLGILQDASNVADPDGNRLRPHATLFSPRDILDEVVRRLVPRAKEKWVAVTSTCARDIPTQFVGDSARFRQVLTKLVSNAVKYTHKGKVRIRVELESMSKHEAVVRVSVADTGVGISEEKLASILESFLRVGDSAIRECDGAELSLAVVSQLVRLMGGALNVKSVPRVGTLAQFTARFRPAEAAITADHS